MTIGAIAPAMAANVTATTDGSSSTFIPVGEKFRVCDTSADGNSVYAQWTAGSRSGRDEWHGGNNTCATFDHSFAEGTSVRFKSCENRNNLPDDCSDWKSARA